MAKFDLIVADCPWKFKDSLKMSNVKRGADSQYSVLSDNDIINLDVKSIASDDAILALWVPSSKLQVGLDTMKSWGFEQKQTFVWVKHKKEIFKNTCRLNDIDYYKVDKHFDINDILSFGMGRLFRQTHEIVLIGTRGKVYKHLQNRSQRSVLLNITYKHSVKPEGLQNRLELMFPSARKIELFARRDRDGWCCIGNECLPTYNEDIRDSIKKLKNS